MLMEHLVVVLAAVPSFSWNLLADLQEVLRYDFMRSALLAGSAISLAAGLVGYFIVTRHQVFVGETLSHVAFAGAMGAALLGFNALLGLYVVTILAALGLNALGERAQPRTRDVTTGIVLAWVLGLGALFLGIYIANPGASGNANIAIGIGILFGSIFGVSSAQAVVLALVGAAVLLVLLALARPLLFASVDPEAAQARGLPVRLIGAVFLVLVGVTVAEAVPAVGALLVFALLLTPAATARLLARNPYTALALSGVLALAITWVGIVAAFFVPFPVSFDITILGFACYLAALAWRWLSTASTRRAPEEPSALLPAETASSGDLEQVRAG